MQMTCYLGACNGSVLILSVLNISSAGCVSLGNWGGGGRVKPLSLMGYFFSLPLRLCTGHSSWPADGYRHFCSFALKPVKLVTVARVDLFCSV